MESAGVLRLSFLAVAVTAACLTLALFNPPSDIPPVPHAGSVERATSSSAATADAPHTLAVINDDLPARAASALAFASGGDIEDVSSPAQRGDWLVGKGTAVTPVVTRGDIRTGPQDLYSFRCQDAPAPVTRARGGDGDATFPANSIPGLVMHNGLVARVFVLEPDFATVALDLVDGRTACSDEHRENGAEADHFLRAVKPEALLTLTQKGETRTVAVGGLMWDATSAYLNSTSLVKAIASGDVTRNTTDSGNFHYVDVRMTTLEARFEWTPGTRHSDPEAAWPPRGTGVAVDFASDGYPGFTVTVNYEVYEGVAAFSKWVTLSYKQTSGLRVADEVSVRLDDAVIEVLAVNEPQSKQVFANVELRPDTYTAGSTWGVDPDSEATPGSTEPLLFSVYNPPGPSVTVGAAGSGFGGKIEPQESFHTQHVYVMLSDSADRERAGLTVRRTFRKLAPQATENPIFMHLTNTTGAGIRSAVDQCAEVGFEMIIMSFGSDFEMESTDPAYIKEMHDAIAYASSKGIEMGGYDCICDTRNAGPKYNLIDPHTGKEESSACYASGWENVVFERIMNFIEQTGLSMVELDCTFSSGVCASSDHPNHIGANDSRARQWEAQVRLMTELKSRNIYINSPGDYFANGVNKANMHYVETTFNLPRWQAITLSRQTIYDNTFNTIPSAGWMFVPLVEYHGGGDAATIEPLDDHLVEYEWYLAQSMGSGVASCYRGYRIYAGEPSKALVKKWTQFYKTYRHVLMADIIHVRRPDLQGVDVVLHANPLSEASTAAERAGPRGLAMVYNPTLEEQDISLTLPVYYTGLDHKVVVRTEGSDDGATALPVDRDYNIFVPLKMAPRSITFFTLDAPSDH